MDLEGLLESRRAGKLALFISRALPHNTGCRLARFIADRIAAHQELPMVRGIRSNQWVVSGEALSSNQLDQAVQGTIRQIAHSFYMHFHYLDRISDLQSQIRYSPQVEYFIERSKGAQQGIVVAGIHMSSFDLILQAATLRGLRALGLSLPETNETVEWQHNFRRQAGVEILPASMANLRLTINRLKGGETVVTGIDRPVPEAKYCPHFFSRPAHLPVHYVSLALKAGVPLVIIAAILRPDGIYDVFSSDLIAMRSFPDRRKEIIYNAERVLEVAADFIRQAPDQWAVVQPVWPETLDEVPQ